jgi:hypothetical protein
VGKSRDIYKLVQRLVVDAKIELGDIMPFPAQVSRQGFEMTSLKQHRWPVVDRPVVVEEIKLGGVDGHSANAQRRERISDKRQAVGN